MDQRGDAGRRRDAERQSGSDAGQHPADAPTIVAISTTNAAMHTINAAMFTINAAMFTMIAAMYIINAAMFTMIAAMYTINAAMFTIIAAMYTIIAAMFTIDAAMFIIVATGAQRIASLLPEHCYFTPFRGDARADGGTARGFARCFRTGLDGRNAFTPDLFQRSRPRTAGTTPWPANRASAATIRSPAPLPLE